MKYLLLIILTIATLFANKTALIIGNASYKSAPLRNTINDAQDISKVMKSLGYEVIEGYNLTRSQMRKKLRIFSKKLSKKKGVGFFYYSGHGMQVEGENYLIPVGADIRAEDEVPDEALSVNQVLRKMEHASNEVNIIILDACRDNPYARSFRSSTRGLQRVDGPTGSIIAYSTAPGSVASDGEGRNGTYTKYFLKYIKTPNITINQFFNRIRRDVAKESHREQIPWESSSLLDDFYFLDKHNYISNISSNRLTLEKKADIGREELLKAEYYYFSLGEFQEALTWYEASAKKGNVLAKAALAKLYSMGWYKIKKDERRVKELMDSSFIQLKELSEAGNKKALYYLGFLYNEGIYVKKDLDKATKLYTSSAEENFPVAQNNLGSIYSDDKSSFKNYDKAVYWYKKAAEQNYYLAQSNLANQYLHGKGVPQDYIKALYWYKKAAEQGSPSAQFNAAYIYQSGNGISKDYEKAIYWYKKAAEQDYVAAQVNLGYLYLNGMGTDKNYKKALYWIEKASGKDSSKAQYSLGIMYEKGLGVPKNNEMAIYWYKKSAEKGNAYAKKRLSELGL